jgi:hypothetical protein
MLIKIVNTLINALLGNRTAAHNMPVLMPVKAQMPRIVPLKKQF